MKKKNNFIIFLIILLLIIAAPEVNARKKFRKSRIATGTYSLPLKQMTYIASSFSEHREDHFHAGIDFGTHMQVGDPVYAFDDGVIFRIKYQRRGYGKVLYLRHKNNLISVYAHLDGFENEVLKLNDLLKEQQIKENNKYVDIYYDHPTIKVKKHQLVAYSGETGEGLPHLHFELREGESNPVNPLNDFFKETDDRTPPYFQGVILCPAYYDSSVNATKECQVIDFLKGRSNSQYRLSSVPVIEGRFKLSVSLYDRADGINWRTPKYIWFYIDGKLAFKISNDSLSYADNSNVGYYYDQGMRGPWHYNVPIELCNPGAKNMSQVTYFNDSLCTLDLSKGTHALKIAAADANMNRSTAVLSIAKIDMPEAVFSMDPQTREACFAFTSVKKPGTIVVPALSNSALKAEIWDFREKSFKKFIPDFKRAKCGLKFLLPLGAENNYYIRIAYYIWNHWSPWMIAHNLDRNAQDAGLRIQQTTKNNETALKVEWKFEYGNDYLFLKGVPDKDVPLFFKGKCVSPDEKEFILNFAHNALSGVSSTLKIDSFAGTLKCDVVESIEPQQWAFLFEVNYLNKNAESAASWGDAKIIVPPESIAESSNIWLERIKPAEFAKMPFVSDIFQFYPRGLPFTKKVMLKVSVPATFKEVNKLALYRWARKKNQWKLIFSQYNPGEKTVEGQIHYLDRVAMIYDNVSPVFSSIIPYEGQVLIDQPYKFIISVKEEGMGVDEENLFFILDSEKILAEYDPDRDIAYIVLPRRLDPGSHTLKVTGKDYAMNESVPLLINFSIK